jgi:hypothetical protein
LPRRKFKEANMSSIPSSAMPHAQAKEPEESGGVGNFAGGLRDLVRDNPKTAMAAGAAVLAGAVAAAAIPLVKGARAKSGGARSGGSKSGGARSGGKKSS